MNKQKQKPKRERINLSLTSAEFVQLTLLAVGQGLSTTTYATAIVRRYLRMCVPEKIKRAAKEIK
jgi:hypothetical protein